MSTAQGSFHDNSQSTFPPYPPIFEIWIISFQLGFTPCKAEQLLYGMELQEKETQKA